MELYPEYLKHLKRFISHVEKTQSRRNGSRNSVDGRLEHSRSTDYVEAPRKSTDRRDKRRQSTSKNEKLKFYEYKFDNDNKFAAKLKIPSDQIEKSRRSVEYHEKSRKSVDKQFERARRSVDWVDRIQAA